jgi:hypothetical protein
LCREVPRALAAASGPSSTSSAARAMAARAASSVPGGRPSR